MSDYAIATTTVADIAQARALAQKLVSAKLAACVQILPIESVYRWKGAVETASEYMLLCKIAAADFDVVAEAIRADHEYDVPEIVMTALSGVTPAYFDWLKTETRR